jgi:hypothetical protein
MAENKKDFFISYNGKDKDWAEWIAWQVEAAGYSVVIQAWDFRPGDNFVLKMQQAAEQADRTLVVLSPNYLTARFTQPEWAAAFAQDPTGAKGTLLPVRVAECELRGLLPAIVYIDLVGLEEADAKKALLAGLPRGRAKPPISPPFPSGQGQPGRPPPSFPESPLRKIRNQIRLLLKQPRAASLYDELAKQAGAQSVEELLIPQQTDSLIDSLETLNKATESCVQRLAEEQKLDRIDHTKRIAREVFGWLVLLAVDKEQVASSGCAFDPGQRGIEVAVPLETEAGTEVMVSSLGNRDSRFKLKYDNKNNPQVVGQGGFTADELEDGIGRDDQLTGILKRIWVEVMKSEAPVPFGQREQKQLQAWLVRSGKFEKSHYYITVPPGHHSSPLADKELLSRLLQVLPSLHVIYIGSEQGGTILLLDEYELWASIRAFLLMLRDLP